MGSNLVQIEKNLILIVIVYQSEMKDEINDDDTDEMDLIEQQQQMVWLQTHRLETINQPNPLQQNATQKIVIEFVKNTENEMKKNTYV